MIKQIWPFGILLMSLAFIVGCASSGPSLKTRSTQRQTLERPAPPPKTNVPKLSPDQLFQSARKFFENKDFNKAYDYFLAAADGWKGQTKELEALVWANRSLYRANRYHDSADLSEKLLTGRKWSEGMASELVSTQVKSLEAINDQMAALKVAVAAQTNPLLVKEIDGYKLKAAEIVENKLLIEELEKVGSDASFGIYRAAAYFRLGEMALDIRNQDEARKYFAKSVAIGSTDWSARAEDILNQLESVRRVEPRTVGVVLPLTGRNAAVAQKTLRGVQMGLGLYNNYPSSFKLAVVDSEGNADNARRGVEKLVKEDNVIAVIGSLLSKNAPAVAAKTNELGVPSLALSQRSGITEVGANVFRNSLTSEMQVRFLVKTAMEDLGLRKFAVVYPNDLYGVEYANIFWDEVLARGGTIQAAQSYTDKETDFRDVVQRLIGTYYVEARSEEYRLKLRDWSNSMTKKTARTTPPEDLLPPIVDFDAIFVPDSSKAMGQISAMLSYNGVKGVKLLGTNLWNVPGIAKRAGNFSTNLLFVDSFVATDPAFAKSSFVRDYKAIFGEEPGIFEIQGYDAALILRQLISEGFTSRETLARALSQLQSFPGSMGPLTITPEREVMRPLVALTLEKDVIVPYHKSSKP